jgi:hypothetical protein
MIIIDMLFQVSLADRQYHVKLLWFNAGDFFIQCYWIGDFTINNVLFGVNAILWLDKTLIHMIYWLSEVNSF